MNIIERITYNSKKNSNLILPSLCLIGIYIRLYTFLTRNDFWMDEVRILQNILNKDFFTLTFSILDYKQSAPIGFLWMNKSILSFFEPTTFVLGLAPFIVGSFSLFIFIFFCKYLLEKPESYLCAFFMALLPSLIYYSNEFKPYIYDFAVASLYIFSFPLINHKSFFSIKSLLFLAIFGSLSLLFSTPSPAFIVPLTFYLLIFCRNSYKSFVLITMIVFIWIAIFIFIFFTVYKPGLEEIYFKNFWAKGFLKLSFSPEVLFIENFKLLERFFKNPLSFPSFFGFFLYFMGCGVIYKRNKRYFVYLIVPTILTLAASVFELYPLKGRLCLHLIPSSLLFISCGLYSIIGHSKQYSNKFSKLLFFVVLASILISFSEYKNFNHKRPNTKPLINYLERNIATGDALLMSSRLWTFYIDEKPNIYSTYVINNPSERDRILKKVAFHNRIWLVTTKKIGVSSKKKLRSIEKYLEGIAVIESTFESDNCELTLYKRKESLVD